MREEWHIQAMNAFVGCHWLGLDTYIATEARRAALLKLAGATLERVRGYGEYIPAEELNSAEVGGQTPQWVAPGPPAQFIAQLGEAFMFLLSHVALDSQRLPGFVATVLEHAEVRVLERRRVTLHVQRGKVNAGKGRLLVPTGQAYEVDIADVWLFNGGIPGFLSPDDADRVIITLTGVAPDLFAPGVLLVQ